MSGFGRIRLELGAFSPFLGWSDPLRQAGVHVAGGCGGLPSWAPLYGQRGSVRASPLGNRPGWNAKRPRVPDGSGEEGRAPKGGSIGKGGSGLKKEGRAAREGHGAWVLAAGEGGSRPRRRVSIVWTPCRRDGRDARLRLSAGAAALRLTERDQHVKVNRRRFWQHSSTPPCQEMVWRGCRRRRDFIETR